jgi:hypothetical protein
MAKRPGTSSVAALVMARTMQRSAERDNDPEMMADGIDFENRALAAIKAHQPELPPRVRKPAAIKLHLPELPEKPAVFQLRLPGF